MSRQSLHLKINKPGGSSVECEMLPTTKSLQAISQLSVIVHQHQSHLKAAALKGIIHLSAALPVFSKQ